MKEKDFLHGNLTLLNFNKLGFRNYLVYMKLKKLTDEKEFFEYLFNFKEITRLKNCSGTYDVQIVFTIRDSNEFLLIIDSIVSKYHSIIQSHDIFEMIDEDFLGLSLIFKEKMGGLSFEQKGSTFQKEFVMQKVDDIKIDAIDKRILEKLKLDASISISSLSNYVNIAPIAVENRVKKLIVGGVIKRFLPLASLSIVGYQWWKVLFKFNNLDKKKLLTYIKFNPNILWYARLLGKWDYQFSIFAKNNSDFHRIIDNMRNEFSENIMNYDALIIFNQFKYDQRI